MDDNKSSKPQNSTGTPQVQWGTEIPFDILSTIFLLCVEEHQFISPQSFSGSKVPSNPGVVVSRVCSHWRSVALRTKELWSNLLLELDSLPVIFVVSNQVLQRSRGSPLRLAVGLNSVLNWTLSSKISPDDFIDKIIVPRAENLKALELFVPFPFIKPILALIQTVQFPALEVLSLRQASAGIMNPFPTIAIDPLICHPKLKTLELDVHWSLANSADLPLDMLPWSQLTTFVNINKMSIKTFLVILSSCPLLESCEVDLKHFYAPQGSIHITAHSLKRLHIRFKNPTQHWDYFIKASLTLPSIRDLAFKVDKCSDGLGWTADLSIFLSNQCGSQLESLYVVSKNFKDDDCLHVGLHYIENFFQRHALSLRQLYLPMFSLMSHGILPINSIKRLVSRALCPFLERLWLEYFDWSPGSSHFRAVIEGVKDSIESGRGALQELHIIYYADQIYVGIQQDINDMILELSRIGVKFHLTLIDPAEFNWARLEKGWFG